MKGEKPMKVKWIGKSYCPDCCKVEWRAQNVGHKWVGFFRPRIVDIYKDFLYNTPESQYPESYETLNHTYCGNCRRILGIKIKKGWSK